MTADQMFRDVLGTDPPAPTTPFGQATHEFVFGAKGQALAEMAESAWALRPTDGPSDDPAARDDR